MSFRLFLFVYVLGGLTFIPLLAAAIIFPAWYLLPRIDGDRQHQSGQVKEQDEESDEKENERVDEQYTGGGATSGTFAVLRSYQFQAATAALNARQANNSSSNGGNGGDGTVEASESVYQSMYRSVFDRNKVATASNPLIETPTTDAASPTKVTRKPAPASVFYIVLRHGHLMLYDSPAQLEVRHVISLAQHEVSLSEGIPDERLTDGDLFIKRTAIVLTPIEQPAGHVQSAMTTPKPFYLFSSTCTEKEEFYLALLHSRTVPPIPLPLVPADVIKLQSTLHSTSLTPEMRGMNALVSRIFLALHRTPFLESLVRSKIEKKMSRIQKPGFIASLELRSIDLGDAAPILSNLRLKDLNISGDLTVAGDIRYSGGIKVVIAAQAKIDLGTRFKTRFVDLVLAASLQRLQGHMQFRIKPPPSNRMWFTFDGMPDMEIKVEPVVSQRQITYTFILRAIEERIRAVVAETLVKPNWDDTPFFDTSGQTLRGGIWKDERVDGESLQDESVATLKAKDGKSMSTPTLIGAESSSSENVSRQASTTSSLSKDNTDNLKHRSAATLPNQQTKSSSADSEERLPPKPLRSPSFASPSPSTLSVTTDEATASPSRADEVAQPRKWRIRQSQVQQAKKDAVEAVRELRDRTMPKTEEEDIAAPAHRHSDPELQTGDSKDARGDNITPETSSTVSVEEKEIAPENASAPSRAETDTPPLTRAQQQRKTLLAATAAATTAARNWSWNAIANRTKASPAARSAQPSSSSSQPMGRGQPLPPPGVPLPGPSKGLWSGLGTVKRKPVPALPPRRNRDEEVVETESQPADAQLIPDADDQDVEDVSDQPVLVEEDDFGPWRENSGSELEVPGYSSPESNISEEALATPIAPRKEQPGLEGQSKDVKTPPPLPSRQKYEDRQQAQGWSNAGPATGASKGQDSSSFDDEVLTPKADVREKLVLGHHVSEDDFAEDEKAQANPTEVDLQSAQQLKEVSTNVQTDNRVDNNVVRNDTAAAKGGVEHKAANIESKERVEEKKMKREPTSKEERSLQHQDWPLY